MAASQIDEQIPEFDENKIPIEGQASQVFRENAGYAWGKLKDIVLSLNIFRTQLNVVAQEVNDNAVQVADDKTFVAEAKTVVTETMATMPDGTINDTTPSTTSTYSSEKIEEGLNEKANKAEVSSALAEKADIDFVNTHVQEQRVFTPLNINKMLTGTFSIDYTANYTEETTETTADYTVGDLIQLIGSGVFYETISNSTAGEHLTNEAYFTERTATLSLTNGVFSVSNGYNSDSGVNNEIKTFNGTIIPPNGWEN